MLLIVCHSGNYTMNVVHRTSRYKSVWFVNMLLEDVAYQKEMRGLCWIGALITPQGNRGNDQENVHSPKR